MYNDVFDGSLSGAVDPLGLKVRWSNQHPIGWTFTKFANWAAIHADWAALCYWTFAEFVNWAAIPADDSG